MSMSRVREALVASEDMRSAGQAGNQPGVHGSEAQTPRVARRGDFGNVLQHPGELAGR